MSSERLPTYRLHKPSGQAVVTLDGHDFYLGPYNSPQSKVEYDRRVAEWLANDRCLGVPSGGRLGLTVDELLAAFWRYAEGYYRKDGRPTSELSAAKVAFRRLRRLYGHTPANEFGPLALKAVCLQMIKDGLVRTSINKHLSRIKSLFKWAAANELVPVTVHHGLLTVAGLREGHTEAIEGKPVRPVPESDVDAIHPYVSRQVWAMIELQRLTGMRPGEVVLMRLCDLETGGTAWLYQPKTHKTVHHGYERVVALGPAAQAVVRQFLKRDRSAYLFSPREAEAERHADEHAARQSPMTPSQRRRHERSLRRGRRPGDPGECYTTTTYRRAVARACKKAGVPYWHPHQLRHNFATMVRRQFGLEAARVTLGHQTAAVTELYAERDQNVAVRVALKVG